MSSPESKCFGCPVQIECMKSTADAMVGHTDAERGYTIARLKKLMYVHARGLLAEPITGEEKVDELNLTSATPEDLAVIEHYDAVINNHMEMMAACDDTVVAENDYAAIYSEKCDGTLVIDNPQKPGETLNICTSLGPFIADLY